MKYIILLIIIIFSGCYGVIEYTWQIPESVVTIQEAFDIIDKYTYAPKFKCFTPEELYSFRYGDCEDFSLMLQYLFESQLNIDADLIVGKFNNSLYYHAWIETNEDKYDATAGVKISEEQKYMFVGEYRYTYPGSVRMVQKYGGFIFDPAYEY